VSMRTDRSSMTSRSSVAAMGSPSTLS
jgi:hypothetical protein